jgi:hypothetical protein
MFNYWFAYPEASLKKENLSELLSMAITDFEPNEAAAIVLDYKLSDSLNEGQIQISNDMLIDKISEEYPEIDAGSFISYQSTAFKAYNGKFQMRKLPLWNFQ